MKEETVGRPGEVRRFTEVYMCQSLPLACSVTVCARYVRVVYTTDPLSSNSAKTQNNKRISWLVLHKCRFPPKVTV